MEHAARALRAADVTSQRLKVERRGGHSVTSRRGGYRKVLGRYHLGSYDECVDPVTSTPPPIAGIRRLETSRVARRASNVGAVLVVICAAALGALAVWVSLLLARLPYLMSIGQKWSLYVTLSLAVLSLLRSAHCLYLLTHTILEFSSVSLRLT